VTAQQQSPPSTPSDSPRSRRVDGRARSRAERSQLTSELISQAYESDDPTERRRLLGEVIVANVGVARAVASRYRSRGVPLEDLEQAALEGLVKAVHRFEPSMGKDLLTYAVPTIRGEVQRYFRDHSWMIRPPRRVQELQWRIARSVEGLEQELGREPEPAEIQRDTGATEAELQEAMAGYGCFHPPSLDRPVNGSTLSLGDAIADDDVEGTGSLASVEARRTVAPAMSTLSDRDRRVVYLRFFEERSQSEIGSALGVTQMQVSRLLSRILRDLRRQVVGPA
jgi:RNA polymerase sigma-B factor